jgi:hypothetical protein
VHSRKKLYSLMDIYPVLMAETISNVENITSNLDFHFAIGQIMDVQIKDDNETRFQTRLIGLKAKKFLLVDQPARIKNTDIKEILPNGKQVVVRTIAEKTSGQCVGFISRVSFKQDIPLAIMYLEYPEKIQVMELRREKRVQMSVAGMIKNPDGKIIHMGMVTDYSQGGCRMEVPANGFHPLEVNEEVLLSFSMPVTGEKVEKNARVCSRRKIEDVMIVGFAFLDAD